MLQNQNVMEMAYLSRQNNNCEASGSGSGASASDEGSPSTAEAKSWRVGAPSQVAEENYV